MITENKELKTLKAEVDKALAEYLQVKRPAHQVKNCPSDLDAETQALRIWQAKRQAMLRVAQGGGS